MVLPDNDTLRTQIEALDQKIRALQVNVGSLKTCHNALSMLLEEDGETKINPLKGKPFTVQDKTSIYDEWVSVLTSEGIL